MSVGLCGFKDELQPVLEKVVNADVLVVGSPVYDSFPTGMTRAFIERLVFPAVNYNDYSTPLIRKPLQCATIYTMNAPENLMQPLHYDIILGESNRVLGIFGSRPEMLCSHETYQFNDYSKYDAFPAGSAEGIRFRQTSGGESQGMLMQGVNTET